MLKLPKRCERNRKRSKRRAIYCPIHGCHIDSVSQKYQLFADRPGQLQKRGIGRRDAQILVASQTAVLIEGEWLEAFWCDQCQQTKWYYIKKRNNTYEVSAVPPELWQQVTGVVDPEGNPSVGEFTRRHSRMVSNSLCNDFEF